MKANFITRNWHLLILFLLILSYFLYFSWFTVTRHNNLYSMRYDLGNMDQTVWNTAHGQIFTLTDPEGEKNVSRFSYHADFLLIFLAPFYFLYSSPITLLIIQSLVVALGSIPIYLLSQKILKIKIISLIFSLSYLLYPALQRANIYEFHAVTLVSTFLLLAFYFAFTEKYKLFYLFSFLAMSTKEQIPLLVLGMGIYILLLKKKIKIGLFTILISLFWFILTVWVIIPYFRQGVAHFGVSFYQDLGDSPSKIVYGFFTNPVKVINTMMLSNRLDYLGKLFSPLGFLSLLSPFFLLSLPELLINLLSKTAQMQTINHQYTVGILPFLFIAAIFGSRRLISKWKLVKYFLPIYILAFTFWSSYQYGPLPFAKNKEWNPIKYPNSKASLITNFAKSLDSRYSVSVTKNIAPHFTNRFQVYSFPVKYNESDYVIVLAEGRFETVSPKELLEYVIKLNNDKNYQKVIVSDNFFVFKRLTFL